MNFLTVNEVAELLGLSPVRVRALAATGELQADKLGRDWIFSMAVVEKVARMPRKRAGRPESTVSDGTLKGRLLKQMGRRPGTVSGLAHQLEERPIRIRRLLDQLTAAGTVETDFERGRGQIWRIAPIRGVSLRMREDLLSR